MSDDAADRMRRARSLSSSAEALVHYRGWAKDYDRDVFEMLRFTGTRRIAALLAEHAASKSAPVIDLGCGTGHLGQELEGLGFSTVDGLDLSPEMLSVAVAKRVYRESITADLLHPLPVPDHEYAAAASAGTFTSGHVDASALPEILRILKPRGVLAIVIADAFWEAGGFASMLGRIESVRRLDPVYASHEPVREGGEPEARFLLYRRR